MVLIAVILFSKEGSSDVLILCYGHINIMTSNVCGMSDLQKLKVFFPYRYGQKFKIRKDEGLKLCFYI